MRVNRLHDASRNTHLRATHYILEFKDLKGPFCGHVRSNFTATTAESSAYSSIKILLYAGADMCILNNATTADHGDDGLL